MSKAQTVIANLEAQQDELRSMIAEERELNDANSSRVEDLEEKLEAFGASLRWMREQKADAYA